MKVGGAWIILLVQISRNFLFSFPVHQSLSEELHEPHALLPDDPLFNNQTEPKTNNGEVISVRITSSVAVGRGGTNNPKMFEDSTLNIDSKEEPVTFTPSNVAASEKVLVTELPPNLSGANLEFIKQLNAKKEARALQNTENANLFNNSDKSFKDAATSREEKMIIEDIPLQNDQVEEFNDNVPIARSIPFYPKNVANYNNPLPKPQDNIGKSKVTSVSFQVVHDSPTEDGPVPSSEYDQQINNNNPTQIYNEPSKIYSQPAKIYSVPAKFYSEPAKVYGEPAKIYSEPAKIYSEPAKIYSEPAKFYSQPASLHLDQNYDSKKWNNPPTKTVYDDMAKVTNSEKIENEFVKIEDNNKFKLDTPVVNNEGEKVQNGTVENNKVGYVVEGKDYRKYRVEERTSDGFIVGEYGVVRNEDGALRGVRYTADGEASPSLIYDGLMKFLQL